MDLIDLDEVIAIEQIAFSEPWTKAMFYSEFFDNTLSFSFVAKEGEQGQRALRGQRPLRVLGYLFAWEVSGEFHLMNIAVDPTWQRKGVGEALMKKMFDISKERSISEILLEVRAGNVSAISLYEKLKFYKVGRRKNYYHAPTEDALILRYDLFSPSLHGG